MEKKAVSTEKKRPLAGWSTVILKENELCQDFFLKMENKVLEQGAW